MNLADIFDDETLTVLRELEIADISGATIAAPSGRTVELTFEGDDWEPVWRVRAFLPR